MVDLRGVDLNLLVSLDMLLAERNVTKAADKLHLSQPALSAQLSRLRALFDDPLLLPSESGRGMTPTSRALALAEPLRNVLKDLEGVVRRRPTFDPWTDERTFSIAASDNATAVVGLALMEKLRQVAGPKIKVAFRTPDARTIAESLERNEVDVLLGSERMVPPAMRARVLFSERFVMAQRKGHPRGSGALDLEQYCSLQHVLVSTSGGSFVGFIDEQLQAMGRTRQVVLSIPQFTLVPHLLATTDFVSTLPGRLVKRFSDFLDSFALPFEAEGFSMHMAWHPREHHDPAVEWLRNVVLDVVN